jgi:hypothetical protein
LLSKLNKLDAGQIYLSFLLEDRNYLRKRKYTGVDLKKSCIHKILPRVLLKFDKHDSCKIDFSFKLERWKFLFNEKRDGFCIALSRPALLQIYNTNLLIALLQKM